MKRLGASQKYLVAINFGKGRKNNFVTAFKTKSSANAFVKILKAKKLNYATSTVKK